MYGIHLSPKVRLTMKSFLEHIHFAIHEFLAVFWFSSLSAFLSIHNVNAIFGAPLCHWHCRFFFKLVGICWYDIHNIQIRHRLFNIMLRSTDWCPKTPRSWRLWAWYQTLLLYKISFVLSFHFYHCNILNNTFSFPLSWSWLSSSWSLSLSSSTTAAVVVAPLCVLCVG